VTPPPPPPDPAALAALAAALLAVDPAGLGGVALRARAGAARDAWTRGLLAMLPAGTPVRRVPPGTAEDRLAGGLDLAATLAAGRPVAERGVLAAAHGGVVVVPSAERLEAGAAGLLAAALDAGECAVEREGISLRLPARFALVALDEAGPDEAGPPAALLERLALHVALPDGAAASSSATFPSSREIEDARGRLASVRAEPAAVEAVCAVAAALGVGSLRAPLFALRAARALAALRGDAGVGPEHLSAAAALVLAPRATVLPDVEGEPPAAPPPPDTADGADAEREDDREPTREELEEMVLRAVRAALPPGELARLRAGRAARGGGRAGDRARSPTHGRRIGTRPGDPRRRRLDVPATVRAAAPWQRVRGPAGGAAEDGRLRVLPSDFRVRVLERKAGTVVVFVVDASGSAAAGRLAEAKGAVELLLAESYVRRDRVALVAFRRAAAELVLPPTRSLARARRLLAGLPGGGGTPLASAADAALALAGTVRRGGSAPVLVFLTDARANVARDGSGGRARAEADALAAARAVRAAGVAALLVDTAPRPGPFAARFAAEMGARYLPLPAAGAREVGAAVRGAASALAAV
jgi:magnesium chelatase subunit D